MQKEVGVPGEGGDYIEEGGNSSEQEVAQIIDLLERRFLQNKAILYEDKYSCYNHYLVGSNNIYRKALTLFLKR